MLRTNQLLCNGVCVGVSGWLAGWLCLSVSASMSVCVWSVSVLNVVTQTQCLRDDILYLCCCIVQTNGQCACRRGLRNDGSATSLLQMKRPQRLRGGSAPEDDGLLVPSTLPLFFSLARSLALALALSRSSALRSLSLARSLFSPSVPLSKLFTDTALQEK